VAECRMACLLDGLRLAGWRHEVSTSVDVKLADVIIGLESLGGLLQFLGSWIQRALSSGVMVGHLAVWHFIAFAVPPDCGARVGYQRALPCLGSCWIWGSCRYSACYGAVRHALCLLHPRVEG